MFSLVNLVKSLFLGKSGDAFNILAAAVSAVYELQAPAVRRIGQNLQSLSTELPDGYAEKAHAFAVESLGTARYGRFAAWINAADMAAADANYELTAAARTVPAAMHPNYSPGISFWVPTGLYILGGAICCGVVQASHKAIFTVPEAAEA